MIGYKLLGAFSDWLLGDGRPDIVLYPQRPKDIAIIFELKNRKKFNEMQDGIEEAFRQIRDTMMEYLKMDISEAYPMAYVSARKLV